MADRIPYGVDPELLTKLRREKRLEEAAKEQASEFKTRAQLAKDKLDSATESKANDFARQQIVKNLISRGTNNINALWEAAKIIPYSKVSEQLALETAHAKAQIPPKPAEHFGVTTVNIGGQPRTVQTNSAGRVYPINFPNPPAERNVGMNVDVSASGNPIIRPVPVSATTNVLNSLPDNLRTNQINRAAMASLAPTSTATEPRTSVGFIPMPQSVRDIPETQQAAPVVESQPIVETQPQSTEVIRLTKDGKKAIFDSNTKQFIRYAPDNE